MIKPIGSDTLQPLFVYDSDKHDALSHEAESLPSLLISSQAAGNAVMMGAGYFNPLKGFMNVADAMGAAEKMTLSDGSFFPVPVMCLVDRAIPEAGVGVGSDWAVTVAAPVERVARVVVGRARARAMRSSESSR